MNSKPVYLAITLALVSALLICPLDQQAKAEVINDSHWMVRSGDSLYSIARKVFPGDTKKQARLRRDIVKLNGNIFKGNANLMSVGSKLRLPAFALSSDKSPMQLTKPVPAKKKIIPVSQPRKKPLRTSPTAVVTADPQEEIGQVLVYVGDVQATNRGSTRRLNRRSKIYKGDTLRTSDRTYTQLRMKDGALISLRPSTEMRLEEYTFNGEEDGTERSILQLIRGGFRTITGAIGHKNKQNYQVRTTIATIGIRGTHYGVMLCESGSCRDNQQLGNLDDGLYGGVVDGEIVTENAQGINSFANDEYFSIADANAKPVRLLEPLPIFKDGPLPVNDGDAQSLAEQSADTADSKRQRLRRPDRPIKSYIPMVQNADLLPRPILATNEQTNQLEQPAPPKAPAGSGLAVAFTFTGLNATGSPTTESVGAPIYVTNTNGNIIFLEQLVQADGSVISNLPLGLFEQGTGPDGLPQTHIASRINQDGTGASYTDLGGNGALGVNWGRWSGNFTVLENGVPLNHDAKLHFIYSPNLTSLSTLTNLGGIKSRIAIYNVTGGTLPTNSAGLVASGLPIIEAGLDFVNHTLTDYSVSADVGGINWYGELINPVDFADLNNGFSLQGACHSSTCDGEASLMFVGADAGGAMTSYSLVDSAGEGISGSALLTPALDNDASLSVMPNDSAILFGFHNAATTGTMPVLVRSGSVDNVFLRGGAIETALHHFTDAAGNDHYQSVVVPSAVTATDTGTNSTVTNTNVAWGRWNSIDVTQDLDTQAMSEAVYIQADNLTTPTQLGGLTGTATFTTVAGAYSAFVNGSAADSGTVSMDVDFGAGRVLTYSASASFSVDTLEGQANNIAFQDLNRGFAITGVSCTTCNGTAAVAFVGDAAEGAISSFSMSDSATGNVANGTSLMTQP